VSDITFSERFTKMNQLMFDLGLLDSHEKSIELITEYISELDRQFDLGK